MARRVYFAFHYQRDIFRVNQIRNSHIVEGCAAAGFQDASIWEEAKRRGDAAIKALINAGLAGTSVTAVLIGAETSKREYVDYEIQQSTARGNGLLGVYIDNIPDIKGNHDYRGAAPTALTQARAPLYTWDRNRFGDWVEEAARRAGK
jgi:MTH538 TIR-like domain (DUF1863)